MSARVNARVKAHVCAHICARASIYMQITMSLQDEFCLVEPMGLPAQLRLYGIADDFVYRRSHVWRSITPGHTHTHRGGRVHCCLADSSISSVAADMGVATV